jgi:hypothetical protein
MNSTIKKLIFLTLITLAWSCETDDYEEEEYDLVNMPKLSEEETLQQISKVLFEK